MATIGVDFGSSYTTVAWLNPATGCPEAVCFNGDGSVKMPSTILHSNGGLIIGYQAQSYIEEVFKLPDELKLEMLSNFIPSLKRILNQNSIEYLGDKSYSHKELLTVFFKYLLEQVKDHCGKDFDISGVSFSYPVEFEGSKIELIRNAFVGLGVPVVGEYIEPISAVKGYLRNHKTEDEETILVFDFGGGTIDVAGVKSSPDGINLICEPKGSNSCGGQDIDQLLYDDLQKKVLAKTGINISANGSIDFSILSSCRRLKELFSGNNELYEIAIPLVDNGRFINFKYSLNRESFQNIIYPKVYEAISVAKQVVENAKANGHNINSVLLIGGSSKISLITKLLTELLPNATIETCGEKDIAVALGNLLFTEKGRTVKKDTPDPINVINSDKIDKNRFIICKNPSCASSNCFKLLEEPGYICLDCGWKGKNVTVKF